VIREDMHKLPTIDEVVSYSWAPKKLLHLMKDAANASLNAARNMWGATKVNDDESCFTHVTVFWFPAHKSKFRDKDSRSFNPKNRKDLKKESKKPAAKQCSLSKMYGDLRRFRAIPLVRIVDHGKMLMLEKWRRNTAQGGYGEQNIAFAWRKAWGKAKITHIECDFNNAAKGGLPSDNNTVERGNRADKKFFKNKRQTTLEGFLDAMLSRVEFVSKCDRRYCHRLKPKIRSQAYHKCIDIHFAAYEHNKKPENKHQFQPNSLDLSFGLGLHGNEDYPTGSEVMVTGTGIEELHPEIMEYSGNLNQKTTL
jgi:hypothetical protein